MVWETCPDGHLRPEPGEAGGDGGGDRGQGLHDSGQRRQGHQRDSLLSTANSFQVDTFSVSVHAVRQSVTETL